MNIMSRLISKVTKYETIKSPLTRTRSLVSKVDDQSLLFYYANIYSQTGQDGILAEIFRRLSITNGKFVEFGAWDGVFLSNSRWLFEQGWDGVFIEADKKKFKKLESSYENTSTKCINAKVGVTESDCLASVIEGVIDVSTINFVSIDVDGMDLDIFERMGFKPDVIVLEGGFNFTPMLDREIPSSVAHRNLQEPLPKIEKTAKLMGYSIVCFYQDAYLVRDDHRDKFMSYDVISLYKDAFYFMPDSFRAWLIDFRKRNRDIVSIEKETFNKFEANPLDY